MQPDEPPALPVRVSRQEFLQVGFSAALGCGLSGLSAARDAQAAAGPRVRAKSVIFVFCTGAPAHQDMWDLKPDAPTE